MMYLRIPSQLKSGWLLLFVYLIIFGMAFNFQLFSWSPYVQSLIVLSLTLILQECHQHRLPLIYL